MEFRDPINAEHLLSQPFFLVNLQFYQSDRVQTSFAKVKFQLQFLIDLAHLFIPEVSPTANQR